MENVNVGCIGNCSSGLSRIELDHITDNIQRTLSNEVVRKIFANYLERHDLKNKIGCLNLYKTCCGIIDELGKDTPLREDKVQEVLKMVEVLDGVPEINRALQESLVEAINSKSSSALLAVLKDTTDRCQNHLKKIHGEFKEYASKPCPLLK